MSAEIPKSEITTEQYNAAADLNSTISLNQQLHKSTNKIFQQLKQNRVTTGGRTRKPRVKSRTRSKKRSKSKSRR